MEQFDRRARSYDKVMRDRYRTYDWAIFDSDNNLISVQERTVPIVPSIIIETQSTNGLGY
jgi:hypothetical protein